MSAGAPPKSGVAKGEPPRSGVTSAEPPPSKLYFRIGEVASIVGVEPHVLRYWEREFRTIRPTKSAKGQRVYSRRDLENLLRVRDLLYKEGFTIAGAKKKLQLKGSGDLEPERGGEDDENIPEDPRPASPAPSVSSAAPQKVSLAAPASPKARRGELDERDVAQKSARQTLVDLRAEVEAFLAELA